MKKAVLCLFLFFISVSFFANFALAELKTCDSGDDSCKIDNGYSCLNDEINTKTCGRMGPDEKVFSLISVGKCKSEVTSDSKFQTDLKYTSLAVLGGVGSNGTENWLIGKNRTTDNIDWFLQIDTSDAGELTCDVKYDSSIQTVVFNEDKTIKTLGSGSCLSEDSTGYWLKISPSCFSKEIKTTCQKSFTTNLLYQKQGASTIYVSEETHSSSAGGETKETVKSFCFGTTGTSGNCNYEGSLWASLVLNSRNYDVTPFLPYLITNIDTQTNSNFLPEAFLYILTGQFGNELLSKQKADKWWQESATNDKFYDTALALYAFQYDDSLQKQNSISWLLDEAQEENGCWSNANNVIRNTAFLLYSIEPRSSSGEIVSEADCTDSGNYCIPSISCSQAGGNEISSLSCAGTYVCCDKPKLVESCSEQGGEICSSSQECIGGSVSQASDLRTGEICCVSGTCEIPSEEETSQCESIGGTCRLSGSGCLSGEKESSEQCDFNDICCIKETGKGISAFWIWTLIILIVLAGLGILFREKLKHLWFRLKHRFLGGGTSSATTFHGPRPPFNPPSVFPRRVVPTQPHPQPIHQPQRQHGELSEVLKKLKEMGR